MENGICFYYENEFCANADCPYCADYCPVAEYPEICKYRKEDKEYVELPNEYNKSNDR